MQVHRIWIVCASAVVALPGSSLSGLGWTTIPAGTPSGNGSGLVSPRHIVQLGALPDLGDDEASPVWAILLSAGLIAAWIGLCDALFRRPKAVEASLRIPAALYSKTVVLRMHEPG